MWDIRLGIIVHSQASYGLLPWHFSYSLQAANAAMSTWWFPRLGTRVFFLLFKRMRVALDYYVRLGVMWILGF